MLKDKKNPQQCQIVVALNMIVGKWKPIILDHLLHGEPPRFNELKKLIPDITQRMLTMHLRELEEHDILTRTVYPQVPPKVEYRITEYGMTLQPMLKTMQQWGANHIEHMKEKNN